MEMVLMLQQKDKRLDEWIENKTPINALCKRPTWNIKIHTEWKEGGGERYSKQKEAKRKMG